MPTPCPERGSARRHGRPRRTCAVSGPAALVLPERHRAVSTSTTIPERPCVREGQRDHAVMRRGRSQRARRVVRTGAPDNGVSCGAGEEGKHWTMVWCCTQPSAAELFSPARATQRRGSSGPSKWLYSALAIPSRALGGTDGYHENRCCCARSPIVGHGGAAKPARRSSSGPSKRHVS